MAKHPAMLAAAVLVLCVATRGELKVYEVGRRVNEFPEAPGMGTPEDAYATIGRMVAGGEEDWGAVSVKRLRQTMAKTPKHPVADEVRRRWLGARVVEVRVLDGKHASVLAQGGRAVDIRTVTLEEGQWLNEGQSIAPDLEAARAQAALILSHHVVRPKREAVKDPEGTLRPYVEYLQRVGKDPLEFVMGAIERHAVVAIGEVHHRPDYWRFNRKLVEDPRFAKAVGTIYLELPMHGQGLVDGFLAAETLDTGPVVEVLRDMMEWGWPDQETVEFLSAVWTVNHGLTKEQRVRVVLVDMARPYKEIRKAEDWRKYDCDRDRLMADNILKDRAVTRGADARGALFVAGFMHVVTNMTYAADPAYARQSAGYYLRKELGDTFYAIGQHSPVLHNFRGATEGRVALGLFDTAFAENGNRAVAFALAGSPFGACWFDADADNGPITNATFADVFDAYLFLTPLAEERMATLVPGFYDDGFVKELDRRVRLRGGTGLKEGMGLKELSGTELTDRIGREWGAPRKWGKDLGPTDAWKDGDGWKKAAAARAHEAAMKRPDEIRAAAEEIFTVLREINWDRLEHMQRVNYRTDHHMDVLGVWMRDHFKANPVTGVELGQVKRSEWKYTKGWPAIPYVLTLKDGTKMEGLLPFGWDESEGGWVATAGLDWHLEDRPR